MGGLGNVFQDDFEQEVDVLVIVFTGVTVNAEGL